MDDLLRVNHDLDLLGRHAEEVLGLDDLQSLVHHRGRIHRDLAPHGEIGVRAGLIGCDIAQRGRIARAKRPAGRGQHDLLNAPPPGGRIVRQRLKNSRMLTVDRQQRGAAVAHGPQEHIAADHQCLFVGEQQALAGACRRQAGSQSCSTDDGGHDSIHLVRGCYIVNSCLR